MSDLNLENIVGFKAVDKDGNEQNVTVDEMVDMVSTRMVMALSETSTFAAAAATGNDVYENELPTVTDAANVRVLQSSGDAAKMTMQSLASKLGGLFTSLKLFPFMDKGAAPSFDIWEMGSYQIGNSTDDSENPDSSEVNGVLVVFTSGLYAGQLFLPHKNGVIYYRAKWSDLKYKWASINGNVLSI